jgi:GTPase SAR1 family protein
MNNNILRLLIYGLPGSGKTTLAHALFSRLQRMDYSSSVGTNKTKSGFLSLLHQKKEVPSLAVVCKEPQEEYDDRYLPLPTNKHYFRYIKREVPNYSERGSSFSQMHNYKLYLEVFEHSTVDTIWPMNITESKKKEYHIMYLVLDPTKVFVSKNKKKNKQFSTSQSPKIDPQREDSHNNSFLSSDDSVLTKLSDTQPIGRPNNGELIDLSEFVRLSTFFRNTLDTHMQDTVVSLPKNSVSNETFLESLGEDAISITVPNEEYSFPERIDDEQKSHLLENAEYAKLTNKFLSHLSYHDKKYLQVFIVKCDLLPDELQRQSASLLVREIFGNEMEQVLKIHEIANDQVFTLQAAGTDTDKAISNYGDYELSSAALYPLLHELDFLAENCIKPIFKKDFYRFVPFSPEARR